MTHKGRCVVKNQTNKQIFETVICCTWSLLLTIVLQFINIVQTLHHHSFYFILQIFTFSIHIMLSLILSDANDPQEFQLINIVQTLHHHSFYFILLIFTFSIHIMFSLIPSDANDPQGLIRR